MHDPFPMAIHVGTANFRPRAGDILLLKDTSTCIVESTTTDWLYSHVGDYRARWNMLTGQLICARNLEKDFNIVAIVGGITR